jgi:hypothetical protein
LFRFAATQRVYRRFLLARGRLRAERVRDRFAALRGDYARYLVEVRGLSQSARSHHAQEVADFLSRAVRPRQQLRTLSRADVERFILIRSREVSRHSMQHTVGICGFHADRPLIPAHAGPAVHGMPGQVDRTDVLSLSS